MKTIRPEELRYGSIVSNQGIEDVVIGYYFPEGDESNSCLVQFKSTRDTKISLLEPIELSEDILLRLGFKKRNYGFFKLQYHTRFYLLTSLKQYYSEIRVNGICAGLANTRYLHQLQSLYYVLTQKELELKPKE